jgi:hypothetical protein
MRPPAGGPEFDLENSVFIRPSIGPVLYFSSSSGEAADISLGPALGFAVGLGQVVGGGCWRRKKEIPCASDSCSP